VTRRERLASGFRAGVPFAIAGGVLAASFGAVAAPVLGNLATFVMSAIVFAGSAQFAAVAVLAAGGSAIAAVVAGVLLNARFISMGVALAPSLRGGSLGRAGQGQAIIDASWAMASRGGGRFDPAFMIGATIPAYPLWLAGTAIGIFAGDLLGDPATLGLDAVFPAFFLSLLVTGQSRGTRAVAAGALGAWIALVLTPLTPPGVPIIAASLAALVGVPRGGTRPRGSRSSHR